MLLCGDGERELLEDGGGLRDLFIIVDLISCKAFCPVHNFLYNLQVGSRLDDSILETVRIRKVGKLVDGKALSVLARGGRMDVLV